MSDPTPAQRDAIVKSLRFFTWNRIRILGGILFILPFVLAYYLVKLRVTSWINPRPIYRRWKS